MESNFNKDMKPSKKNVYCNDCGRTKMLFETEKKAENFMRFNNEEIESESGYSPQRSYYCIFCLGWHLTSIKEKIGISKKEQVLEQYIQEKERKKAELISNQEEHSKKLTVNQEERIRRIRELESQIQEMEPAQKEIFFAANKSVLTSEIELLLKSTSCNDNAKLKDLRLDLEILCIVRKQNGFQKPKENHQEFRENEIEEWRLWATNKGYECQ